ncbi:MAG: hypothetical protein AB1442_02210 [Nitrospirota bacterium]
MTNDWKWIHMKIWHRSLIVCLIVVALLYFFGAKRQAIGLLAIYIVTIPVTYFVEKKHQLLLWQKRLVMALIVYPLLSLLIPAGDVFNFFIASLIFTLLLLISGKFKNGKQENAPMWEGEDKEK